MSDIHIQHIKSTGLKQIKKNQPSPIMISVFKIVKTEFVFKQCFKFAYVYFFAAEQKGFDIFN